MPPPIPSQDLPPAGPPQSINHSVPLQRAQAKDWHLVCDGKREKSEKTKRYASGSVLMTSQLQGVSARGPEVLLLQEIQSALEFNFQLRTFRQLQFMATSGFHQVSSQGRLSRAFGSFFRILVLDAAQCAHSGALGCGLARRLLRAGLSFDQPFPLRSARSHTMIPRHSHNIGHDRERPKSRSNLVEYEPNFCPAGNGRGLHARDVAADLRARWQINPAPSGHRFQCPRAESPSLFGFSRP